MKTNQIIKIFLIAGILLSGFNSFAQDGCVSGNCYNGYGAYVWSDTNDKYVGNFYMGKMNGKGIYYWADGSKYDGQWSDNKRNGIGTHYYLSGQIVRGKWEHGKYIGETEKNLGIVKSNKQFSEGCAEGDCSNGTGVYIWADGSRFVGTFKNEIIEGTGTFHWTNGSRYEGEWSGNKRNGIGAYHYADGRVKKGLWKNDVFVSSDEDDSGLASSNPSKKQPSAVQQIPGCFEGDCKNGRGALRWKNGDRYEGEFKSGYLHGTGVYVWEDGTRYAGQFQSNKKHGKGKYIYADGSRKNGIWKNGIYIGTEEQVYGNSSGSVPDKSAGTVVEAQGPDKIPPRIVITQPTLSRGVATVSRKQIVYVKGYATDETGIKSIRVTGFKAKLANPGAKKTEFSAKLSLIDGKNDFWVEGKDLLGNNIKLDYALYYESEQESLKDADRIVIENGSGKRTALVIGNANYSTTPLKNAVNDADSVATELRNIGFEVLYFANVNREEMTEAIVQFGAKIKEKGGAGLFYYAGHGVQVKGENYLVPIGPDVADESEVNSKTISVSKVMDEFIDAENELNIVILDACRDNPYGDDGNPQKGLATITSAPVGTFVAYSTSPGMTASDGPFNNGLYTQEFLRAIRTPGLKLEEVFKQVRSNVRRKSFGDQVPWENSSIERDFYFRK